MYLYATITVNGESISYHINEVAGLVIVTYNGTVMAEYSTEHIQDLLLIDLLMAVNCRGISCLSKEEQEYLDDALVWQYSFED